MHRTPTPAYRTVLSALVFLVSATALACDSPSGTQEPTVATVAVNPPTAALEVTQTQQLTATARDAAGNTVTGKTVSWRSENPAVATVTPAGNVSAISAGTARITATVDGREGEAVVTVTQPAVTTVTVTPGTHTLGLGGSIRLTVTLRGPSGNVLTGRAITYTSTDPAVATVDSTGLVRGLTPGVVTITVTSEGVSGTAQVTVSESAAVIITGVSPSPLQEGQNATISGSGFSPEPSVNTVLVAGVPATVLSATETSLTIRVPAPSGCLPARDVTVRVDVSGLTDERAHPWRPASFLDLAVGQQLRLSGGSVVCMQLDASASTAEYLVGVQSTSEVANQLTPIQLRSSTPASVSGNMALAAAYSNAALPADEHDHGTRMPTASASAQRLRAHREAELDFRVHERRHMLQALGGSMMRARVPGDAAGYAARNVAAAVPPNAQPGDTVEVKYPTRSSPCTQSTTLSTVVRYRGTRSIWVEDLANPAGGFTTAEYNELGNQFDTDIYAADEEYFGTPTDLDGNSRIVIVVTRQVNRAPNVLGLVYFADLYPDDCPAANGGEFFYGIAPDPDSLAGGSRYTTTQAFEDYPLIIAHELAHVIQVGRRIYSPTATAIQTIWELEGQATLAEEIVGHRVTGRQPRQNYGFDVAWNNPEVHPVDWYINPFIDLVLYFGFESADSKVPGAPEECGWLDQADEGGNIGPCIGGRNVYGVSWSLLRWISDHFGPSFPGGEAGLHRAMVVDTRSGFRTLETVTGRPINELLAQWSAMLYMDDRIAGLDPKLTKPSWEMHGSPTAIWSRLTETAQLRPRERSFTGFTDEASVRSGSTAYFRISGSSRPATALSARSGAGDALPQHMQVWVVRVR